MSALWLRAADSPLTEEEQGGATWVKILDPERVGPPLYQAETIVFSAYELYDRSGAVIDVVEGTDPLPVWEGLIQERTPEWSSSSSTSSRWMLFVGSAAVVGATLWAYSKVTKS